MLSLFSVPAHTGKISDRRIRHVNTAVSDMAGFGLESTHTEARLSVLFFFCCCFLKLSCVLFKDTA